MKKEATIIIGLLIGFTLVSSFAYATPLDDFFNWFRNIFGIPYGVLGSQPCDTLGATKCNVESDGNWRYTCINAPAGYWTPYLWRADYTCSGSCNSAGTDCGTATTTTTTTQPVRCPWPIGSTVIDGAAGNVGDRRTRASDNYCYECKSNGNWEVYTTYPCSGPVTKKCDWPRGSGDYTTNPANIGERRTVTSSCGSGTYSSTTYECVDNPNSGAYGQWQQISSTQCSDPYAGKCDWPINSGDYGTNPATNGQTRTITKPCTYPFGSYQGITYRCDASSTARGTWTQTTDTGCQQPPPQCTKDSDCPTNYKCLNGGCVPNSGGCDITRQPDCKGCKGQLQQPICNNGQWSCPITTNCPPVCPTTNPLCNLNQQTLLLIVGGLIIVIGGAYYYTKEQK